MFRMRAPALGLCLILLLSAVPHTRAAEVTSGEVYCFSTGDFSEEDLTGICITALPGEAVGCVMLGDRILRPGDVLAADQISQMTFLPARTESDTTAVVSYLPIFEDRVDSAATMTISIRGKKDQAPIAENFAAETYKNLPIEGRLKVKEPENQAMTFTLVRLPKRGEVVLREDGTFTYTPRKNKVGIDSFVYTATDEQGNVSRETTVTITIVKPTDSTQYTDTAGESCRFAAEWMKNTGIFTGETLDGNSCFQPEKAVTQGEFLTMLVRVLDIPLTQSTALPMGAEEIPTWLQPYYAAAVRSGLVAGLETGHFSYDRPITGEEAAVMLQNALDLRAAEEAMAQPGETAASALQTLGSHGIDLPSEGNLTRGQAAQALYAVSRLADTAPGIQVLRKVG